MSHRSSGESFDYASKAFADPLSIMVPDPNHSADETRLLLIGRSTRQRVLVLIHGERSEPDIRLISARPAIRRERRIYEEDA